MKTFRISWRHQERVGPLAGQIVYSYTDVVGEAQALLTFRTLQEWYPNAKMEEV